MIASKGSTPCGKGCPYYEETGEVQCIGGPKKANCRLIMLPHWVDCHEYDVRTLRTMEITEEQFQTMQQAAGITPKKVRKPWKKDHKEIHAIGTNTRAKNNEKTTIIHL